MVSLFQAIVLSVVQGLTEWFPISSSGHLAIMQEIFGFQDLGFDVYLHFASVAALIILLRKDLLKLLKPSAENTKYLIKVLIAIVPVALAGIYYREYVRYSLGNFIFMGLFFMIFGGFIYSTKYAKERKDKPSKFDSFVVGVSQILALFPGISRSGMAIGSGLTLGFKKEEAIKFSFLIAIPIILGASMLEAKNISGLASEIAFTTLLTSFTITLLTSLLTIKFLIDIVKKDKFYYFGIYNFLLGLVVFIWGLVRVF